MTRVNNDSLAMGELSGYIIRYGQDPANLTETVRIDSADTMEYTVTNLDNGTWYFSIQVEDVEGLVSAPSQPVSKKIQG
ncbi:fibronectin type III domain-containing protein [Marinobacter sp. DUT-3]|uniref:fibronectin type III domain-containing protein n=1 Tax=unclassified Marinobacter TaxID=83889 RepID=UPI00387A95D9